MSSTVHVNNPAPVLTLDQVERVVTGELRIYYREECILAGLNQQQRAEFEQAKVRGYLVRKGRRGSLSGVWFHWCEATQHPYLWVRCGPKYATVDLDLIGQRWRLPQESIDAFFAWTNVLISDKAMKRGAFIIGNTVGITVIGVRNERAEEVAQRLLTDSLRCRPLDIARLSRQAPNA